MKQVLFSGSVSSQLQNKVWVDSIGTRLRTFQFQWFGQFVWVDRFLANQGNFELKIFTMDAKYYFEDLSRKKSRKNYKDAPRDLEPILDRMDDFLTSDTL